MFLVPPQRCSSDGGILACFDLGQRRRSKGGIPRRTLRCDADQQRLKHGFPLLLLHSNKHFICVISIFKKHVEPLLDVLSEQSNNLLSDVGLLQFFSLPDLPQNIPQLYRLIRMYRIAK